MESCSVPLSCLLSTPSSSSPRAQRGDGFCHPLQGTHSSSSKRISKTSCAPRSLDTILVTLDQGYSEPAELGRKTYPSLSSLKSITHTTLGTLQGLLGCLVGEKQRAHQTAVVRVRTCTGFQLPHLEPLPRAKAAVSPASFIAHFHSRQSTANRTWKPTLSHHATKETRSSSRTAHICFCTTTPISRLLIKKNILAMRNRSAAWHLFYLCNLSETALHCNESNKHLLCANINIRESKRCNVVQKLAEWIQRNLTRPSFRHLNGTF